MKNKSNNKVITIVSKQDEREERIAEEVSSGAHAALVVISS